MSSALFGSAESEIVRIHDEVPRWIPPREGWLKLNVDAIVDHAAEIPQAAGGGILRDEKGKWCWAFSCDLGRNTNIIAAHLLVVRRGLSLALERRIPMLVLESPRSDVVDVIKSSEAIEEEHPLSIVVQQCRALAHQPWRVEFVHVQRQANECAQILAERGHSHFGCIVYDAPPVPRLAAVIENELVKD